MSYYRRPHRSNAAHAVKIDQNFLFLQKNIFSSRRDSRDSGGDQVT